jgi:RNA polymerase sigma-70 factor (ECF subfamily)
VRSQPETPQREVYEGLRPLLFSIAYGIVSSVAEAEDIVQEAFLRFHRAQGEGVEIDSPRAWLSTVATRLAINQVRSARVRRETYVGTWLPEPLLTDRASDASVHAETLLREVFDYGYDEIAAFVGKSEENCRQIATRARRQVEAKKPRFEASRRRREELARRFFDAIGDGDLEGLTRMLAADAVSYSDGGGKASAFPHPMHGRERIARVLLMFGEWRAQLGAERMQAAEVNGHPGALFVSRDGRAVLVVSLDIAEGLVQTIRSVSNPEKLRHLGARAGRHWPVEG